MAAFLNCEKALLDSGLNPVIIAAILSFGFVFMLPFEDGNGRIHRFIIHYILSKTGFAPENIIFPLSSVMLKNIKQYDEILESFSKLLMKAIDRYEINDKGELTVLEVTKQHYQFIDYTHFAEYLFSCIQTTINDDFKDELDFIVNYDQTKSAIQNIIDMPDLKIDRIIKWFSENQGKLGKKMRTIYFKELSDETIEATEKLVSQKMLK